MHIVFPLLTDGLCVLFSTFPRRSGCDPNLLKLENPKTDYPNIRVAAARMLKAGHGLDVLAATYSRLFVDEYSGLQCSAACDRLLYGTGIPDLRSRRSDAGDL